MGIFSNELREEIIACILEKKNIAVAKSNSTIEGKGKQLKKMKMEIQHPKPHSYKWKRGKHCI